MKEKKKEAGLKKGQMIVFSAMDEFTGQRIELTGTVMGDFEAVRKRWPIEMAEADIYMYLVMTCLPTGLSSSWYAVHLSEVLEVLKENR